MELVQVLRDQSIATVRVTRGKVNALTEEVVERLSSRLKSLSSDPEVKAVILTGQGKFFSFGFDVPHFYPYSQEAFADFLRSFATLYTDLFVFPKPVVAALNGHTIAGGCMLAQACDYRVMVSGRAKISLNEVTFGSSVFAGSVETLKFCVGDRNAATILLTGGMYSADEALKLGLVDEVADGDVLMDRAMGVAHDMADRDGQAFASIKRLLKGPIAETMRQREEASVKEFVEIWYSPSTREQTRTIMIQG